MKQDINPLERRRKVKPYPNVPQETTTFAPLRSKGWTRHLKTLAIAYLILFGSLLLISFIAVTLR